jgi:hypothetical protein
MSLKNTLEHTQGILSTNPLKNPETQIGEQQLRRRPKSPSITQERTRNNYKDRETEKCPLLESH